jgi:hypothetical protein
LLTKANVTCYGTWSPCGRHCGISFAEPDVESPGIWRPGGKLEEKLSASGYLLTRCPIAVPVRTVHNCSPQASIVISPLERTLGLSERRPSAILVQTVPAFNVVSTGA